MKLWYYFMGAVYLFFAYLGFTGKLHSFSAGAGWTAGAFGLPYIYMWTMNNIIE